MKVYNLLLKTHCFLKNKEIQFLLQIIKLTISLENNEFSKVNYILSLVKVIPTKEELSVHIKSNNTRNYSFSYTPNFEIYSDQEYIFTNISTGSNPPSDNVLLNIELYY